MTRKTCLILTGLCLAAYLPFITKGVNYDDFVFLDYAQRLTKNPTRCVVDDYVWQGMLLQDLVVFESTHPPLIPYWIKTVSFLVGQDRLMLLHLAFFPFLWLATMALADLLVRWCKVSAYWAVGLTLGPLFLPIATNLMTDTALFAFWFAAIACWDRALDKRWYSPWHLATAGLAFCACFTAYQGLGLAVVLLAMGLLRSRFTIAGVWICGALLPFVLWLVLIYIRYDFIPFLAPPREELSINTEVTQGMILENMWMKARVMLLYLGAGTGLMTAWWLGLRLRWWAMAAGWGLALTAYLFDGPLWGNHLLAWFWLTLGLSVFPVLSASLTRFRFRVSRDHAMTAGMIISAAGIALFQIAVAAFAAPRYVFVLLGAILLLTLRLPRPSVPRPRMPVWLIPALCVALGLLVTAADWRYADAQRVEKLDLPQADIHFVGEKGVKYSAQKAGLTYFLPGMEKEVFYLLVPSESDQIPIPVELRQQWEESWRETLHCPLPVRTMHREAGAGFFLHTRGLLPFAFSSARVEEYVLYKIFRQANPPWKEDPNAPPRQAFSVGEILPERPVTQTFQCDYPGLTRLRLFVATHQRVNQATLVVTLREISPDGTSRTLYEADRDTAEMADNSWLTLDFPPLASKGKTYQITVSSPDASPGNAVTLWANRTLGGSFKVGPSTMEGRPAIEVWCLPGRILE